MVLSAPLERLVMKPKLYVTVIWKHISARAELKTVMMIPQHFAQLLEVQRSPSSAKMEVSVLATKELKLDAIQRKYANLWWAMKPKSFAQMMQASIGAKLEPKTAMMIPQSTARQLLMPSLSGSYQKAMVFPPPLHRQKVSSWLRRNQSVNSLQSHAWEVIQQDATKELKAAQMMVPFATPSGVISKQLLAQMEMTIFVIQKRTIVLTTAQLYALQGMLVELKKLTALIKSTIATLAPDIALPEQAFAMLSTCDQI